MDVPEYQNCTGVVISNMNCSTYLSVSIISSSQNLSKPHIKRYSYLHNFILGNNKYITFHSCNQKETSAHVFTMTHSVKGMTISPKPLSRLEKTRVSLASSNSASASTTHSDSNGVGVIPSGNRVPEQGGG